MNYSSVWWHKSSLSSSVGGSRIGPGFMPTTQLSPTIEHELSAALGILLVNLGTPDAPTATAVRRYLAEFLWDPHVVGIPRPLWWLILHGYVLRVRPARSARAYAKIWTDAGSPLLLHSQDIATRLQLSFAEKSLEETLSGDVQVALGMSYGKPSLQSALDKLLDGGARRIVVLPLYPQYSSTTTASVKDAVDQLLSNSHSSPDLHFVSNYHDAPGYIAALANSIREYWERNGRGDKLLMSFHGVPQQTVQDGDPYHDQCLETASLLAAALDLNGDDGIVTFQSRLGRGEWLRPYTDETITALGSSGLQNLDIVCPGFAADCLETLEEIAMQNSETFKAAGGEALNYIPALNARDDHVAFLAQLAAGAT